MASGEEEAAPGAGGELAEAQLEGQQGSQVSWAGPDTPVAGMSGPWSREVCQSVLTGHPGTELLQWPREQLSQWLGLGVTGAGYHTQTWAAQTWAAAFSGPNCVSLDPLGQGAFNAEDPVTVRETPEYTQWTYSAGGGSGMSACVG